MKAKAVTAAGVLLLLALVAFGMSTARSQSSYSAAGQLGFCSSDTIMSAEQCESAYRNATGYKDQATVLRFAGFALLVFAGGAGIVALHGARSAGSA